MKPHTSAHVSMLVRKSSVVYEEQTVRKFPSSDSWWCKWQETSLLCYSGSCAASWEVLWSPLTVCPKSSLWPEATHQKTVTSPSVHFKQRHTVLINRNLIIASPLIASPRDTVIEGSWEATQKPSQSFVSPRCWWCWDSPQTSSGQQPGSSTGCWWRRCTGSSGRAWQCGPGFHLHDQRTSIKFTLNPRLMPLYSQLCGIVATCVKGRVPI